MKNPIKYLTKGKRSFIFLEERKIQGKTTKLIIKKSRSNTETRIAHETEILKLLNKHKIGPKLIEYKNNQLTEEYVEGITIEKFLTDSKTNIKDKKIIVKNILKQCRTLDKLKLNKEEMVKPYKHIIITSKLKPIMIDFERARFTEKPANTTQFFQYILRYKLTAFNEKLKQKLKNYKQTPSEENFKELIKLI